MYTFPLSGHQLKLKKEMTISLLNSLASAGEEHSIEFMYIKVTLFEVVVWTATTMTLFLIDKSNIYLSNLAKEIVKIILLTL